MTRKISILVLAAVFALEFASCSFFSTSLGTWAKRDTDKFYSQQTSRELVAALSNDALYNDAQSSQAVLKALGEKDDLQDLSLSDKEKVLNLMTDRTVSLSTITDSIENILGADKNNLTVEFVFNEIISNIMPADTQAAVSLLSDPAVMQEGAIDVIFMSAVSVTAQVLIDDVSNHVNDIAKAFNDVTSGSKSPKAALNELTSAITISQEDEDVLESVFDTIKYIANNRKEDVEQTKFFGVSIKSMLSS